MREVRRAEMSFLFRGPETGRGGRDNRRGAGRESPEVRGARCQGSSQARGDHPGAPHCSGRREEREALCPETGCRKLRRRVGPRGVEPGTALPGALRGFLGPVRGRGSGHGSPRAEAGSGTRGGQKGLAGA